MPDPNLFALTAENLAIWFVIFQAIVGTAAQVAAITPNKSDDKITQFLQTAINKIGFNVGNAKNAD